MFKQIWQAAASDDPIEAYKCRQTFGFLVTVGTPVVWLIDLLFTITPTLPLWARFIMLAVFFGGNIGLAAVYIRATTLGSWLQRLTIISVILFMTVVYAFVLPVASHGPWAELANYAGLFVPAGAVWYTARRLNPSPTDV